MCGSVNTEESSSTELQDSNVCHFQTYVFNDKVQCQETDFSVPLRDLRLHVTLTVNQSLIKSNGLKMSHDIMALANPGGGGGVGGVGGLRGFEPPPFEK